MKVKQLIKKLEECEADDEVFSSGLNKSFVERSLKLITKVEKLNKYVVIVDGS